MGTRTVSGTIFHADGSAWAGGALTFELVRPFEAAGETFPKDSLTLTLDVNGQFETELGVPDDGAAMYQIVTPDERRYTVNLEAGTAVTLDVLLAAGGGRVDPDAALVLINNHIEVLHPEYNVRAYGAVANGVTDNTTDIQEAITAAGAAGGGEVIMPPGRYVLGAALMPKEGVTVRGTFPTASTPQEPWDGGFTVDGGTVITYPGGLCFGYDTSKGIGTDSSLAGFCLENLGFDDVGQIMATGAPNKSGLVGSVVRNILASGVTGIAFDLVNPLQSRLENVKICAAQLLRLISDYDSDVVSMQPGNCTFHDLYCYVPGAYQSLPTIHLWAKNTNSRGQFLNYCNFTGRTQVNKHEGNTKVGNFLRLEGEGGSAIITGCKFEHLDLEGYAAERIYMSNTQKLHMVFMGAGANGSNCDADIYLRDSHYNHIECYDAGVVLDMDSSDSPTFWTGVFHNVVSGGSYPLGVYYDLAVDQIRLGTNNYGSATILADIYNGWTMPDTAMIKFTNSGGVGDGIFVAHGNEWVNPVKGLILCDLNDNQFITLPNATTCPGKIITIKKTVAGGAVYAYGVFSQLIDGASPNSWIDAQNKYLILQSDGSNWWIVGKG